MTHSENIFAIEISIEKTWAALQDMEQNFKALAAHLEDKKQEEVKIAEIQAIVDMTVYMEKYMK